MRVFSGVARAAEEEDAEEIDVTDVYAWPAVAATATYAVMLRGMLQF